MGIPQTPDILQCRDTAQHRPPGARSPPSRPGPQRQTVLGARPPFAQGVSAVGQGPQREVGRGRGRAGPGALGRTETVPPRGPWGRCEGHGPSPAQPLLSGPRLITPFPQRGTAINPGRPELGYGAA